MLRQVHHTESALTKFVADTVELLAGRHCLVQLGKRGVDHSNQVSLLFDERVIHHGIVLRVVGTFICVFDLVQLKVLDPSIKLCH